MAPALRVDDILAAEDILFFIPAGVRVCFQHSLEVYAMLLAALRNFLQNHGREIIVPLLCAGGMVSGLIGIISMALRIFGLAQNPFGLSGLVLLFCGVGAIAFAQLLELLTEIEGHLAAIREQVGKGVFGLLG